MLKKFYRLMLCVFLTLSFSVGIASAEVTNFPNGISSFGEVIYGSPITTPGQKYFVSRNVSGSGDGKSWDTAYKTIGEAITAVNTAYTAALYPSKGRNTVIYIGEGWYAEVPLTLTANDCHIIAVAPGNHDSTVLYGVPVAGTFSGVSGGPALTLRGSNCTIEGLGLYTSDPLYASLQNGVLGAGGTTYGNKILNCSFIRDVADGSIGGILDYGADGTLIQGCFFSTSCKDYGIKTTTNGVINPVNCRIIACEFVGTETGIIIGATGHNTLIKDCIFRDDSSDRADTITLPVSNSRTASSTVCIGNYWAFTDANAVTGNQAMMIDNNQLAAT